MKALFNRKRFEELYVAYRDPMIRWAYPFFYNWYDAEDAVQEAFFRLMRCSDKLDLSDPFKTKKLCKIVLRNVCINLLKKWEREIPTEFAEEGSATSASDNTDGFFKKEWIKEAIMALPLEWREILVLKYEYGFSAAEIATIVRKTTGAVSKTLSRARMQLYEQLKGASDEAE